MKAAGTNTAHNTRAMAINAEPTSSMLRFAASRGARPAAMLRSTFSTTTIASSTTIPTARTRPKSDRLLSENPNIAMKKKVPISDTGIATIGMTEARRKLLGELIHCRFDLLGSRQRVRPRKLIDGERNRRVEIAVGIG